MCAARRSGPGACATGARCRSAPPTWATSPEGATLGAVLAGGRRRGWHVTSRRGCERGRAWELTAVHQLPGGNVAVVCAADRPVALKLNPRTERLAAEACALRFWRDTGAAAELLDARDDDYTMLMERLQPGKPTLTTRATRRAAARRGAASLPCPQLVDAADRTSCSTPTCTRETRCAPATSGRRSTRRASAATPTRTSGRDRATRSDRTPRRDVRPRRGLYRRRASTWVRRRAWRRAGGGCRRRVAATPPPDRSAGARRPVGRCAPLTE